MSKSITIEGLDKVLRRLDAMPEETVQAMASAFFEEGHNVMSKSKQIVPVDLSPLKNSGTVLKPDIQGHKVSVALGYGGPASEYALEQHENLDFEHEVGQAKYLEQPFNENKTGLSGRMAKRVERNLKRGRGA